MTTMPSAPEPTKAPTATPVPAPRKSGPPAWLIVALACAGQFLVVLDISVVNVALPSMRADLGLSAPGLQWVVNAYAITFAGFLLLGGRAGDLFGRKRTFLAGLALFTLASLSGGLAQSDWELLAARAVQGLGAAILAPSTLTLLTAAVPEGPARARAIATWTAVGAGGGSAGGLVGGVLVDTLSWRWVLLINVPIGALVLAGALRWLPETRSETKKRLDVPGAVLVTAGLATLAFGISRIESEGWTSGAALLPLAAGAVLIAAFLAVEARARSPLMPLGLLRLRQVASANVAMFISGSATFCMWFFMTLYAQNVLGYTPLEAGLATMPSSLAVIAGSKLAPRLMRAASPRATAVLGALIAAAGFAWQSTMSPDGSLLTDIVFPGILMMFGAGMATTPLASLATSGTTAADSGIVSGLVNTSRTIGGSLGLAVMATIAATRTDGHDTPAALTDGYALVFRTSTAVLLAGAALMWAWLPRGGGDRA
ncbi:MFS transporter [Streptomyces sp. 4F14]|uniref:MFS transporter n=1 Tax=Streptomyces sp. 4F14 TaxID=3394380 RepID=UPI003A85EB7F